MKDINLISFKTDDKVKKTKNGIVIVLFLVAIMVAISFGSLLILTEENASEIVKVEREITKYAEVDIVKTDIRMYNEKLKQMEDILDSVSGKSVLNIKVLKQIAKAMPSDIYITNYSVSKTGDVAFVGKSGSSDSIAHFRYKLDESKEFDDIAVKSIMTDALAKGSVSSYTFDMSLKLKR